MPSFCMLAGTVSTGKNFEEIVTLLSKAGFKTEILEDEIELKGRANLIIRSGFDHEYIVVGDAIDNSTLKQESQLLSDKLKQELIQHEFEFYDMTNELVDVIDYKPL